MTTLGELEELRRRVLWAEGRQISLDDAARLLEEPRDPAKPIPFAKEDADYGPCEPPS